MKTRTFNQVKLFDRAKVSGYSINMYYTSDAWVREVWRKYWILTRFELQYYIFSLVAMWNSFLMNWESFKMDKDWRTLAYVFCFYERLRLNSVQVVQTIFSTEFFNKISLNALTNVSKTSGPWRAKKSKIHGINKLTLSLSLFNAI